MNHFSETNLSEKITDYKISIIVPVYNARKYLEQSIDSILQQTYHNIELLLIDDESSDGSGEICDRYAGQDSRVKVIHQQNRGCTGSSLTGLAAATGDYYMFVDSDDYVDADMLSEMSKHLVGKKGEIVCCNHVLEKSKGTIPAICLAKPGVYEGDKLQTEIKDRLLGNEERQIPFSRCMKLYEKSVFEGNEKYCDTEIYLGEDFNLVYPALLDCSRLVIMEGALFYHYRFVETSMVHRYNPNILENVERSRSLWQRVSEGKGIKGNVAAMDREYCLMLILVMKNELRNPDKNYLKHAQEIFTKPEVREKIRNTPITLTNKANVLLYLGMRYPNKILLKILRVIISGYDRSARKMFKSSF